MRCCCPIPRTCCGPTYGGRPELWLRNWIPDWAKTNLSPLAAFRLELYQLLGAAGLAALAFALSRLAAAMLAAVVGRILAFRQGQLPPAKVFKYLHPVGWLLACLALRGGALMLDLDKTLLGLVLTVLNPLAWVIATWAVFRVIDLIGAVFEMRVQDGKTHAQFTEMVWPVGSVAAKIALVMALMLHLMALFAWDVTTILTGLGIGGVAFALGAQDSLGNLFGSFTLLADRPFVVGETVQIGEGGLGVVERVGLRSTSIRTVEDTLMVVPNSNLTTMNITNFGRRRFRRFTTRHRGGLQHAAASSCRFPRPHPRDGPATTVDVQGPVRGGRLRSDRGRHRGGDRRHFDVTTSHEEAERGRRCYWAACGWPRNCGSNWPCRLTRRPPRATMVRRRPCTIAKRPTRPARSQWVHCDAR